MSLATLILRQKSLLLNVALCRLLGSVRLSHIDHTKASDQLDPVFADELRTFQHAGFFQSIEMGTDPPFLNRLKKICTSECAKKSSTKTQPEQLH